MNRLLSSKHGDATFRRVQPPRKVAPKDYNRTIPTDVLPIVEAWVSELPQSPKTDYLRAVYLSKFVDADPASASLRKESAISKWLAQELVNADTNARLLDTAPEYEILPGVTFSRFSDWTRALIARVIGETIPFESLSGDFSGGSSTSHARVVSHPAHKFVGKAHITCDAVNWFDLYLTEVALWSVDSDRMALSACGDSNTSSASSLQVVPGSIMFTVPKNSVIDRVAAKEPDINMFLQKGVGNHIRRRLRSFHIDLNDQSRNQDLARLGSLTGSLATLDLSSASDSITCELVSSFLPPIWASYLNDIRSHTVTIDGVGEHTMEMFSSMGNGFTFELESLLFWAFAKASAYFTRSQGVISVYGDDIIVPVQAAQALINVLNYLGFKVNPEKSFVDGPFRESCGGHYHCGKDITPFFIKGPVKSLTDLIHLLNQIRKWASLEESLFLDEDAWVIWSLLSELVPLMFWGGDRNTAGKYQLVSPGWPRKRLSPYDSEKKVPVEGLYLQAMLALSKREGPAPLLGFSTSDKVLSLKLACRIKPAKRWTWHDTGMHFLIEV